MRHEIVVLWQIHDLTRSVVDALLEGLKKPAKAHPNKFSLEAKALVEELCRLINERFNLDPPWRFEDLPPEYWQVIDGVADVFGLENQIIRYRQDDAVLFLKNGLEALKDVVGGENYREQINIVFRFCHTLIGECRMACVVPEEVVLNEVDIGADIHAENP